MLLGTYTFAQNATHGVLVSDQADGVVVADAIKFENGDLPLFTYYVHPDHLNTPRVVMDSTNGMRWRWDTADPFGMLAPTQTMNGVTFTMNHRFPGQYGEAWAFSGLVYNYFRDYDPSIGRYIQSDPIGLQGGINTYAYVGSNPLSRTDPLGLFFDIFGTGSVQAGVHVLAAGLNVSCGAVVSVGASCQACRYCTVCARFGPGLYAGAGIGFGGGVAVGDVSNFAGDSIGLGFDVGTGFASAGGSAGVGVSGNVFTGPIGTPVSGTAVRGRAGFGVGASAGIELCRTKILVCDFKLWGK